MDREPYLQLLSDALTGELWGGRDGSLVSGRGPLKSLVLRFLHRRGFSLVRNVSLSGRQEGRDWPALAHTMIGKARMDNVRMCVESVLREGVPGDLIETGVWRGGAAIFMRGILAAWGDVERKVWVADSFAGLPARDLEAYPQDGLSPEGTETLSGLAVSLEEVRDNFRRYGLLDAQVAFLEGWFKDTLPCAPLSQLAVARLDGDLYESTMDALVPLYPKLQPGGYLIVDDYGTWPACRAAVDEYRAEHGVTEPLVSIDWASVYWRKQR